MKEKKRKPRTGRALTWRVVSLTLALWLACMVILTWCVASDMRIQVKQKLQFYINNGNWIYRSDKSWHGVAEQNMIDHLGRPYIWINLETLLPFAEGQTFGNYISSDDWMWGKWDLYYGFEPAIIHYDENGDEIIRTGHYLTFDYTTAEHWSQQIVAPTGVSYIALDEIPGGAERFEHILSNHAIGDVGMGMLYPLLRLTGWFEESEFHPTLIENGDYINYQGQVTDLEQLAALDTRGKLEWETMLTAEVPEDQELVTIYAFEPGGYNCTTRPVTVKGETFDTLADYLDTALRSENPFSYEKHSLLETIVFYSRTHTDDLGQYRTAVAIRCAPLQYAVLRLVWTYIISFAVVALILWRILRRIRRNLTAPLMEMAGAAQQGYLVKASSGWAEPAAIEEYFVGTHQTLAENKTEITRLRTALEYAHDAEENRKALISNITHELKTPLAIIHSYTECLQEDISPENRAQYLATILEETERMDAMVLQMLELSRLEAGRVRLATEPFSLLELTNAIAEKLEPLMAERKLTLSYGLAQDFVMTADESRMGQVITNLLSNALKYTTEGGTIRIQIFLTRGTVCLRMTNTAPHLSDEALHKVWDSFYRADSSRHTPGTGLGLALVKSIIALHGGSCTVRNTVMEDGRDGVEFGFEIPLK
ncbi:MAG: HAMP domain-containing histidine kinase [Oscillospiraceae bacterium]|nr:HAMP domain-containing histidine kinase [Oscillospiraceae bacterium]